MALAWAKSYLPRSLYGRAALILLVPLVALQLIVSVVFIQRHYTGVTEQMSRNVALEIRYLLAIVAESPNAERALERGRPVAQSLAFELAIVESVPASKL